MTLDEAIEHANQVADSYKDIAPACKCAHEHRQLADWLTELKVLRTENIELRELAESRGWIARMLGQQTARVVNLQELALDMFNGMCDHDRCDICPHWQDGYNGCEYHARMRKLGVEVD